MIRVYLAAPYSMLSEVRDMAHAFEANGFEVTSRWLFEDSAELTDEWARIDLADVARADVLVACNQREWRDKGTGGRHVEFGYAVALMKPIVLLGEPSNIFHTLSTVEVVDTLEAAIAAANRLGEAAKWAVK